MYKTPRWDRAVVAEHKLEEIVRGDQSCPPNCPIISTDEEYRKPYACQQKGQQIPPNCDHIWVSKGNWAAMQESKSRFRWR